MSYSIIADNGVRSPSSLIAEPPAQSALPSFPTPDISMLLTPEQQVAISSVERVGASLSLFGVFLIIIAYAAFKRLRTVPNTFILCASVANVGASIACLIGYSGIAAGDNSALCQAQAFLLEMFMQSDPWWSLAMAVNVYLVFFHAANPTSFRHHLWIYCLVCYGVPAIPAIVLLVLQKYSSNEIYGNATLWCWIDDPQSSLRIWSYYLPIWVCILLSALIYVAVGYHVFHTRNQLRNMTLSNQAKETSTSDIRASADRTRAHGSNFYGTVTTEVQITAEISDATPPLTPCPSIGNGAHYHHMVGSPLHPWNSPSDDTCVASPKSTHTAAAGFGGALQMTQTGSAPFATIPSISSLPRSPQKHKPSSSSKSESRRGGGGLCGFWFRIRTRLRRLDPVKLAYLRTSFVFALSVLVTWTPSSINRVYALTSPHANYPLNLASAIVLPLQGVWNAVIYFTTSWRVFREEMRGLTRRGRGWRNPGAFRDGSGFAPEMKKGSDGGYYHGAGRTLHGAGWRIAPDGAADIEMSLRSPPPVGTVRVVRGSSL